MHVHTVSKASKSLVGLVKSQLTISVFLLLLILAFRFVFSIIVSINQHDITSRRTRIQSDVNGLLLSMIDQETGLRGYILTNDQQFLGPFTNGRPQYLRDLQDIKAITSGESFALTQTALADVEVRADTWYTQYAQVQMDNMRLGKFVLARSAAIGQLGKRLFDQFRSSETHLQNIVDQDINTIQNTSDTLNVFIVVSSIVLSLLVILLLWYLFTRFARKLRKQLDALNDCITRLIRGDLSARTRPLASLELDHLGQALNRMAGTLQEQQRVLSERDVLGSVQELNTILNQSLDFDSLTREFLNNVLISLSVQLVALYLYNPQKKVLTLVASQGFDQKDMHKEFCLGEGVLGMSALNRTPLHLLRPNSDEAEGLRATTIFGLALPTSIYHVPLLHGQELVGVLSVGSLYSLQEKVRNVLDVVANSLSAAISNAQSYQHIRAQAEAQERSNKALLQQRDELTVLNSALEEANRVRSQFLSTMSHELRTPLAAIIGFSQMVLRDLEQMQDMQRQRNNMERILKNSKHLLTLINGVLDLSKIDSGRMNINYSQIDVNELLHAVVEETQSIAIEQQLNVRVVIEGGVGSIETDQMKLRQILLNLLSNAMKFTPSGEVILSARRIPATHGEDERVSITVADTGIGIAPEMQERIFEAFFQADSSMTRKFGGTGLGLAIVRQLATLLNGTLELHSQEGQGSIFTITLPGKPTPFPSELEKPQNTLAIVTNNMLSQDQQPALTLKASTESTRPLPLEVDGDRPVVLVVDDNADVVKLITGTLESSTFQVVGVQDQLKVLDLVQQLHPCAITLDIMMPNLNGWQLLHHLKSNEATASIPVIVLTVLAGRTIGYVLGADDYLIKSFDRDTLLDALKKLIPQSSYVALHTTNKE